QSTGLPQRHQSTTCDFPRVGARHNHIAVASAPAPKALAGRGLHRAGPQSIAIQFTAQLGELHFSWSVEVTCAANQFTDHRRFGTLFGATSVPSCRTPLGEYQPLLLIPIISRLSFLGCKTGETRPAASPDLPAHSRGVL